MTSSSKKTKNVRVTLVDAELEFTIRKNTSGKELFDQVAKSINLREVWYFGLQYTDAKGFPSWLKLNKKVLKQDIKKEPVIQFEFRAKFYPECVSEELIQDTTLRLFYLQVKELILSDEIYTPPETAVMLASYSMQVKFGDFVKDNNKPGSIVNERLLPQRVLGQYRWSMEEWEQKIIDWWTGHRGQSRETAMLEYLKLAQDLEMYGVNYFEIRNKKGSELYLGVDALGLNIYKKTDKLTPEVGFPWGEIHNISFNDKRFVIKTVDKKDFVFFAQRLRINKRILALCMGNHELYIRRRQADSTEVQKMKQEAREERLQRQQEQERLAREVSAREAAEQKRMEYEATMEKMQHEMEQTQKELEIANETIHKLQEQLFELNEAKRELQSREHELQLLNQKLDAEQQNSAEEREKLLAEIATRESQVLEMRTQIDTRTIETNKLQDELDERRSRAQNKTAAWSVATGNGGYNNYDDQDDNDDGSDDLTNVHIELTTHENGLDQRELDRQTVAEKNVDLRRKFDLLSKELDAQKDTSKLTDYDALHMQNKMAGRDKYKTLRQIRSGNTKRRIDQYENM